MSVAESGRLGICNYNSASCNSDNFFLKYFDTFFVWYSHIKNCVFLKNWHISLMPLCPWWFPPKWACYGSGYSACYLKHAASSSVSLHSLMSFIFMWVSHRWCIWAVVFSPIPAFSFSWFISGIYIQIGIIGLISTICKTVFHFIHLFLASFYFLSLIWNEPPV